jgi:NADPH-dependent F420 reductase
MKIAVLGGTGHLGKGLVLRLASLGYEVIVGSRSIEKAEAKAKEYSEILGVKVTGLTNEEASKLCDIAILAIPWKHAFSTAEALKDKLANKIVVSPVVPMEKVNGNFTYVNLPEGSAAEKIASILKDSRVVSAYHNIPAKKFANLNAEFEWDVAVCGDDEEAKSVIIEITNEIKGLRALDAGSLANSRIIESLTPLLINIAIKNNMKELGVRFV